VCRGFHTQSQISARRDCGTHRASRLRMGQEFCSCIGSIREQLVRDRVCLLLLTPLKLPLLAGGSTGPPRIVALLKLLRLATVSFVALLSAIQNSKSTPNVRCAGENGGHQSPIRGRCPTTTEQQSRPTVLRQASRMAAQGSVQDGRRESLDYHPARVMWWLHAGHGSGFGHSLPL